MQIEYEKTMLSEAEQEFMLRFKSEMSAMQNLRKKHEGKWKRLERQFDARLDSQQAEIKGKIKQEMTNASTQAVVKIQIDRNTLEQQLGEEGFNIPYRVVPNGKNADSYALDVGKYTLDFFVQREGVVSEIIDFRWDRGKYGTGFLDSSIWVTKCVNNVPKGGDFMSSEFQKVESVDFHIGLRNVNVWDVWLDERATKWKDVRRAVRRRCMDIEEFRATYGEHPSFRHVKSVMPVTQDSEDMDMQNMESQTANGGARNVYLFDYYNEVTGEFVIIANRCWPVYVGFNVYKDSKIPLTACQMYKDSSSIWGMPIGDKTISFLSYMNSLTEMALDKVAVSSMPPLVLGNNGEIDGEMYSGGGELPILNFNGDVSNFKQMQFDSRIDPHLEAISMARNEVVQNTGINPLDYNKPLSGINPFVAGLQEQARKAKMAVSNAMFDVAISEAFSKMLENLIRFGPKLYGKNFEKIIDGEALQDVEYLSIQVPNRTVVKVKDGKMKFDESYGEYGYFDFTDDVFKDKNGKNYEMSVKVVTPTTQTLLDALRKDEFNTFVKNLTLFRQIYPNQQPPISPEELYEMMGEVYGFDIDNVTGITE